jgi:glyoxylase-like metal-dependent hydrolase (beta-lactamase superfamily II)
MIQTLHFPFPEPPAPHSALEIAPGVHWLRFALPFALDHINLWLLADGEDGWTLVDCGIGLPQAQRAWEALFDSVLLGKPLKRIIVTHYHPDHVGQAAWLAERFGAPVLMTPGEHAAASAMHQRSDAEAGPRLAELFARHGLDAERTEGTRSRGNSYRQLVERVPANFEPLQEDAVIRIGGRQWRVLIGRGHAPEHACLYCAEEKLLIAGDQILPTISSNVSVRPDEPDKDPLADFLGSLDRLARLPADTRVLPSHGLVFEGLHARVEELRQHHREQFEKLRGACREPRSASDLLELMFRRRLDLHTLMFAMGECIAHLEHLYRRGDLVRELGGDGVYRYCVPREA